jgi:hypothetical protein
LNFCRTCFRDFSSVAAFDRHRTGVFDYTFTEGLGGEPPVEDGRRCMDRDEVLAAGMELDRTGRWRIVLTDKDRRRLAQLREAA